jgi:hypothetical protein
MILQFTPMGSVSPVGSVLSDKVSVKAEMRDRHFVVWDMQVAHDKRTSSG